MPHKRLAIIIPAYKATFLKQTLDAFEAQTCHDFNLYIGDDCSPEPIKDIVDLYIDRLPIVYRRFDENLGSTNLTLHWQRCIDMSNSEPYIWLFSDDDIVSDTTVEAFYQAIKKHGERDLFHFPVNIIDENDNSFIPKGYNKKPFDAIMSCKQFIINRLFFKINSFIVEYIFRRDAFNRVGGFESFDLAWGADDALWIKLSKNDGITSIDTGLVGWRHSRQNISPNVKPEIVVRKLRASIEYLKFISQQEYKSFQICVGRINYWAHIFRNARKYIPKDIFRNIEREYFDTFSCNIFEKVLLFVISRV